MLKSDCLMIKCIRPNLPDLLPPLSSISMNWPPFAPSLRLRKQQVAPYVLFLSPSMYAQLLSVDRERDADIESRGAKLGY